MESAPADGDGAGVSPSGDAIGLDDSDGALVEALGDPGSAKGSDTGEPITAA